MESVHVILNNACNQSCPFCFAQKEMKTANKKEITVADFDLIVKKSNLANIRNIYFLGGEPTIHSSFTLMLEKAMKHFIYLHLFTNGIFSNRIRNALAKYGQRIFINVNVTTPAFLDNPATRNKIIENIDFLKTKNRVSLSITNNFLNLKTPQRIIDLIDRDQKEKFQITLNLQQPTLGDKNLIGIKQFPLLGKNMIAFVKFLEKKGYSHIGFNSGWTPCMFDKEGLAYIKQHRMALSPNCQQESGWFSVTPNNGGLETYRCYPLSSINRYQLDKKTDMKTLFSKYKKTLDKLHRDYILPQCLICPHFGLSKNKCSGPCLAFRINALKTG